jgi:hypothetical protein
VAQSRTGGIVRLLLCTTTAQSIVGDLDPRGIVARIGAVELEQQPCSVAVEPSFSKLKKASDQRRRQWVSTRYYHQQRVHCELTTIWIGIWKMLDTESTTVFPSPPQLVQSSAQAVEIINTPFCGMELVSTKVNPFTVLLPVAVVIISWYGPGGSLAVTSVGSGSRYQYQ